MNYHVSVMAIVLSLFGDAVWASLVSSSGAAPAAPADAPVIHRDSRDSVKCSWCKGCPLDGLCDSDECGCRPESDNSFYRRIHKFNNQM